jgi:hypothetical protein
MDYDPFVCYVTIAMAHKSVRILPVLLGGPAGQARALGSDTIRIIAYIVLYHISSVQVSFTITDRHVTCQKRSLATLGNNGQILNYGPSSRIPCRNSTSHIFFILPSTADSRKAFRTSSADASLLKALRTPATLCGAAFRTDVFPEPLFA